MFLAQVSDISIQLSGFACLDESDDEETAPAVLSPALVDEETRYGDFIGQSEPFVIRVAKQ